MCRLKCVSGIQRWIDKTRDRIYNNNKQWYDRKDREWLRKSLWVECWWGMRERNFTVVKNNIDFFSKSPKPKRTIWKRRSRGGWIYKLWKIKFSANGNLLQFSIWLIQQLICFHKIHCTSLLVWGALLLNQKSNEKRGNQNLVYCILGKSRKMLVWNFK